uniref:Polycystin domain-containing protein n=1 Tax=Panagrolaimus davidi TaxID=227884 RepID=A0A914PT37_9BILA
MALVEQNKTKVNIPPTIFESNLMTGRFGEPDIFNTRGYGSQAILKQGNAELIKNEIRNILKMAGRNIGENAIFVGYEKPDSGYHIPPAIIEPNLMSGGFEGSENFDAEGYGIQAIENGKEINVEKNEISMEKVKIEAMFANKKHGYKHVIAFKITTEIFMYLIFLGLVTTFALSMHSKTSMKMSKAIEHSFTIGDYSNTSKNDKSPFQNMKKFDDIWDYFENQIMAEIYSNNENFENDNISTTVFGQNKYLGKIKLRMLKVGNKTCEIPDCFKLQINSCTPPYNTSVEEKSVFEPANLSGLSYTEAYENSSIDFTTVELKRYDDEGFVQYIPTDNRELAYSIVQALKENQWIDNNARIVFIDFTIFNPAFNIYTAVKIYIEIEPNYNIYPQISIKSIVLDRYVTLVEFFQNANF